MAQEHCKILQGKAHAVTRSLAVPKMDTLTIAALLVVLAALLIQLVAAAVWSFCGKVFARPGCTSSRTEKTRQRVQGCTIMWEVNGSRRTANETQRMNKASKQPGMMMYGANSCNVFCFFVGSVFVELFLYNVIVNFSSQYIHHMMWTGHFIKQRYTSNTGSHHL